MKLRKITAIILALAMIFALGINVSAVTDGAASIDVYIDGDLYVTLPVTVSGTTTTVKNAIDQNTATLEPEWDTVVNYNPNFGSTAKVIRTMMGAGTVPVGSESGITAQFWSSQYPGYGIESTSLDANGKTVYNYIYVGYDWDYEVNGVTPVDETNDYELYMDQCYLEDGDEITLSYELQITRWSEYDYWLTA